MVVGAVDEASTNLDAAQLELQEVSDSAVGVGTRLSEARDEATAVVSPLAASARRAKPLADVLPDLFGTRGEKTYLLALLNPSEQRFSGGAPLTVVPLTVADGKLTMGEARDTSDPDLYRVGRWEKVEGNSFHNGKLRLSTANYAPDWSVSGEELLRGWERRTGQETDGLIAVDVVALADMLRITGPVQAPIYGQLDAGNFTQKLVGDYDTYPDNEARHDLNRAIVPVFAERLLAPGQGIDKIESLRTSAQRSPLRHVDARSRPAGGSRRRRPRRRPVRHRPRLPRGLQPEHQRQQVRLLAASHPHQRGAAARGRLRPGQADGLGLQRLAPLRQHGVRGQPWRQPPSPAGTA